MKSVVPLAEAGDVKQFGGKAANLAKMLQANLPVPSGFAVGLDAFDQNGQLSASAIEELLANMSEDKNYAVRSSALSEDAEDASWAGQFETFLNVKPDEMMLKVLECHNSAKKRAEAYAQQRGTSVKFDIAVVVQEMIKPDFAGVLFTKDPLSNKNEFVCEYVEGLGEKLVSGQTDPSKLNWPLSKPPKAPFNTAELTKLAQKVEALFNTPQDIEWASAEDKLWLLQARAITVSQSSGRGYYLGEPDELFYWGPSRAKPLYMSDFMAAAEEFFVSAHQDPKMPNPPKTLVLFYGGKNVWLINAKQFAEFTKKTFEAYQKQQRFEKDRRKWQQLVEELDNQNADATDLAKAQSLTLFAEFSLYGAEGAVAKKLSRLQPKQRQEVWGAFTLPDKPTFLSKIDDELIESGDPKLMANKYAWIDDGYRGVSDNALGYFKKRLPMLEDSRGGTAINNKAKRAKLAAKYKLTTAEVDALNLARRLAEFMDDRKAWMMRTRRDIKNPASKVKDGWFYHDGEVDLIGPKETKDMWERYVEFKASTTALNGLVASNGGRHFVNGEVVVVTGPTDPVPDDHIIVVPASSPSYVPLMRKARAMITDHGGMMSHAAIVGREFNLPCIVGTKQATKVLQTGDKIVLDLVKGEINK